MTNTLIQWYFNPKTRTFSNIQINSHFIKLNKLYTQANVETCARVNEDYLLWIDDLVGHRAPMDINIPNEIILN